MSEALESINKLICPHCGVEDADPTEYIIEGDEEEIECICGKCFIWFCEIKKTQYVSWKEGGRHTEQTRTVNKIMCPICGADNDSAHCTPNCEHEMCLGYWDHETECSACKQPFLYSYRIVDIKYVSYPCDEDGGEG